jgi:hypothetical protein
MADRYRDRPFPADNGYDRGGDPQASAGGESDPLAELARLIGQTDPFHTTGRANQQVPPRTSARDPYQQRSAEPVYQRPAEPSYPDYSDEADVSPAAGPPPWLQRANRQEIPQPQEPPPDYPSSVHPLQRYAAARPAPAPEYQEEPQYADEPEPDPSRYDDALYGQLDAGARPFSPDPAYADDAYAYRDGYDDGAEEPPQKRRGGMVTVIVVLALAVIGTGAAFAYRTYVGTPRTGEPPVIRADTSPTKIVPAPSDGSAKLPDRMATGDGTEKLVPREEAPVDVNAKAGPRVVFPALNPNGNPPSVASVAPGNLPPPNAGNGTMSNSEPRKIRTLTVKGDQPDGTSLAVGSAPLGAAKQAPTARAVAAPPPAAGHNPPASANASANAPMSLVPQGNQPAPAAEPQTRLANTNPIQTAPAPAPAGGGYMVQVSSQRSEADAQASFRALQGKFPAVLGAHSPSIKRADLGEKGIYYRAMVGPFGSSEEASQFCGNLKSAGGQCVVQRN